MPPIWSRANPVDIAGDADAARYASALEALLADPANDAVLVMNVPTALASPTQAAQAVVRVAREKRRGHRQAGPRGLARRGRRGVRGLRGRAAFRISRTKSHAVEGFMHLVRYREAQDALMATPPSLPVEFRPDVARARAIVQDALRAGKAWLDPIEVDALLSAYAIPVAPVALARDPDEAARLECAAAGGRTDGRRQDPVAGYRAQIRSRRRAAEPHQRAGGRRRRPPTSWRAPGPQGRTRASPA